MQGWISLHRKFLEWEWYSDKNVKILFLHCLLKANHSPKKWQGKTIDRGQFVTGRKILAKETGLTESQIRTVFRKLNGKELTIKTTNKYSIVTVVNYNVYQENDNHNNQQLTNKQPADDQQVATTNNDNNNNNDNKYINIYVEILDHLNRKANTNFKYSAKATQRLINARLKEKYTVEDFKRIIDNKCKDWLNNKEMSKYLRPSTLFRPSNFENYYNEVIKEDGRYNANNKSNQEQGTTADERIQELMRLKHTDNEDFDDIDF